MSRLREVAKKDMILLMAVMCARQHSSSLFVMSLRVDNFASPNSRLPMFFDCFVCTARRVDSWRPYGRVMYEAIGLHCEAHAEAFHAVCGDDSICCTPHYHPDNEYAWRAEGREYLAHANEASLEEPVTPSTASSHH